MTRWTQRRLSPCNSSCPAISLSKITLGITFLSLLSHPLLFTARWLPIPSEISWCTTISVSKLIACLVPIVLLPSFIFSAWWLPIPSEISRCTTISLSKLIACLVPIVLLPSFIFSAWWLPIPSEISRCTTISLSKLIACLVPIVLLPSFIFSAWWLPIPSWISRCSTISLSSQMFWWAMPRWACTGFSENTTEDVSILNSWV